MPLEYQPTPPPKKEFFLFTFFCLVAFVKNFNVVLNKIGINRHLFLVSDLKQDRISVSTPEIIFA